MFLSSLWRRPEPRWIPSEFSELPAPGHADRVDERDWCVLAGGLALLLSRCTPRGAHRHFPASLQAWRSLKRQLKNEAAPPALPLGVLNELRHEIAGVADAATCDAARRCMERTMAARPMSMN